MARKNIYRGISFLRYKDNKTFKLRDVELVKQDLLSHIFTTFGERIMMPSFGTSIKNMPFEQLDDFLLLQIGEQLTNVIEYDPRVDFLEDENGIRSSVNVEPDYDNHKVTASIDVRYIELDFTETIIIELDFED